jgi:hypothetical protein
MTSGLFPRGSAPGMLPTMDVAPVSETLPETYRRVLDRVADLETAGYRREADLVRRDAIAAYSRRWNQRTATRLERLAERATRVVAGQDRARLAPSASRPAVVGWLAIAPNRARGRLTAWNARRAARRGEVTLGVPTA